MKHCKIYLLCLTSWLLLSPTHVIAGGGEAPSPFYIDKSFNILPPSLTARRAYKRSSANTGTYYSESADEFTERRKFNIQAWSQHLKRSLKEAEEIVYNGNLPDDLDDATQAYLKAVAEQEPLVTQPQKDQQPYNLLIEKLTQASAGTDSEFLRQRYVFLILRLAHYSGQYDKVEALYAQYQQERQTPSAEMSLWIDALYAGALQRKGKRSESAYRFAHIFQDSKTRRLEAQLNFKIKTDAEWNALLEMCKNDDEKALMYFMRSLKTKANSLQELKTIYTLAPNSRWVDEALVRELEYVQFAKDMKPISGGPLWQQIAYLNDEQLIADSNGDPKLLAQTIQRRSAYLTEFSELVASINDDKKRNDQFLSDYAVLYLKLLQDQAIDVQDINDFQAAYTDKARLEATKPLEYFVYLESLKTIDNPAEQKISAYLKQLMPLYRVGDEYGDNRGDFSLNIMDYTYIKLEPLYLKQKADWQPAKTYASKNRGTVVLDNMLVVELLDFQKLLKEKNTQHSVLLQDMLKDMKQTTQRYALDDAVARKYLSADMPEKALAALAKAPKPTPSQVMPTTYNPFNTSVGGNNRKPGSSKTLKTVIETLLALKKQVKENPKDAQAHYLLGTLHYNMSWFGNSPMLLRYYRQTSNWRGGQIDMSHAENYYRTALEHSNDRNLTAKVLYALAKIEQVKFYTSDDTSNGFIHSSLTYRDDVLRQKAQGLGEYLGKLKSYRDTDYFSEVISQCADYRYFHSE